MTRQHQSAPTREASGTAALSLTCDEWTALTTALDLLTNCVSPGFRDQALGWYAAGTSKGDMARNLYPRLMDAQARAFWNRSATSL